MAMVISFINQMNKKFGPGVLLPMLFGKYRNPQEEQRIFMFMDLKSSTSHAEKLGHIKYSALIRDSFIDINKVLVKHRAEVYQYVGDEIVVSWPQTNDLDGSTCVEFYFACQEQFNQRSEYYLEKYGIIPKFKAGLHQGIVTTVEVGDVKRDLAYHGDTIGTMSLGGVDLFNKVFSPMFFNSYKVPSPYCYRCPVKKDRKNCSIDCIKPLEKLLKAKSEKK